MPTFDNSNFSERIRKSTAARAAAVDKLKARPGPDDPRVAAKAAERKAFHEARLARDAEKEQARREQLAREVEHQRAREEEDLAAAVVRETEIEAEQLATQAAKLERAKHVLSSLADQKTTRDARYAARKARQSGKR